MLPRCVMGGACFQLCAGRNAVIRGGSQHARKALCECASVRASVCGALMEFPLLVLLPSRHGAAGGQRTGCWMPGGPNPESQEGQQGGLWSDHPGSGRCPWPRELWHLSWSPPSLIFMVKGKDLNQSLSHGLGGGNFDTGIYGQVYNTDTGWGGVKKEGEAGGA